MICYSSLATFDRMRQEAPGLEKCVWQSKQFAPDVHVGTGPTGAFDM
jgi:hypothetical protein